MRKNAKISPAERDKIAQWVSQKVGVREIGRRLGRSHGSICAELARNAHKEAGYVAIYAQALTGDKRRREARRHHPLKNVGLYSYVREKLGRGSAPEMIAGRLEWKCEDYELSRRENP